MAGEKIFINQKNNDPFTNHTDDLFFLVLLFFSTILKKLFANRDYVYNRRFFIDRNRKLIIIVNKSIDHPTSPKQPNIQRVKDYWSYMVIRSTSNSLKTPGVEYVLTYFDNPGVVLPQSVTSWVAQKQMPEFLHKLYIATLDYAQVRRQQQQQEQEQHKQKRVRIEKIKCTKFNDIIYK